jgi:two-component system, NtrC family, sensor kinase
VKNRIRFHSTIEQDLPKAGISQGEIQQVLLNLIRNAIQAIPAEGEIRITAVAWKNSDESIVDLVVRDTGTGIPESEQQKIFDPFYTTKPQGVGTGLGLSVVYGLVTKYGGSIEVASRPGEGTAFHMKLPILNERFPDR